ncbi:MAG: alpha-2-macroglobulin family protein, partial [Bacteroidota bacterium]
MKTKDKFGTAVEVVKYFTLHVPSKQEVPTQTALWHMVLKSTVEPGEKARFELGSAAADAWILFEQEFKGEIVKREWLNLKQAKRQMEIAVEEKHRGGMSYHLATGMHGRFHSLDQNIYVPWTNKQLNIEFATFRDKLQPGEKEEWTMKISGDKKDMVAAEMLMGAYDASLDAFRSNYWSLSVNPSYYSRRYWELGPAFSQVQSRLLASEWNTSPGRYSLGFDEFNWFGYSLGLYGWGGDNWGGALEGAMAYDEVYAEEESDEAAGDDFGDAMDAPPAPPKSAKKALSGKDVGNTRKSGEKLSNAPAGNVDGRFDDQTKTGLGAVKVRTNLNETAFFYPHLKTNEKGEILVSFTIPEALTRWKIMGLAHTKDLKTGFVQKEL